MCRHWSYTFLDYWVSGKAENLISKGGGSLNQNIKQTMSRAFQTFKEGNSMKPTVSKRLAKVAVIMALPLLINLLGGFQDGWAQGDKITLRMGHPSPVGSHHNKAAVYFAERVAHNSNGMVAVDVFPGGQLGTSKDLIEGMQAAIIDICLTGSPHYAGFVPELQISDLPFLFKDYGHAYKVFDGPTGEKILKYMEGKGLKGLAFFEVGFRSITNSKRPVKTPDDVKGLKIRVTPSPIMIKLWEALGAYPTPMPINELYLALQQGVVDAQENPVVTIYTLSLHEVQKYLSFTRHVYTPNLLSMSLKTWLKLSPENHEVVLKSAQEAAVFHRKLNRELEESYLEKIKNHGMIVEENPDREAFRKVVGPVYDLFYQKMNHLKGVVSEIEAMK
jgi:tripartite ATP-independent transporter DctP family solute receptor